MDGLQISGAAGVAAVAVLGPGLRSPGSGAPADLPQAGPRVQGARGPTDPVAGSSPLAVGTVPTARPTAPRTLPSAVLFQLRTSGGAGAVRGGPFLVSPGGEVLTPEGLPLVPPVIVPPQTQAVFVTSDGRVMALFQDGSEAQIGALGNLSFENGGISSPLPNQSFAPSGPPVPTGTSPTGPIPAANLPPLGGLLGAPGNAGPGAAALAGAQAPRNPGPGVGSILDFLV